MQATVFPTNTEVKNLYEVDINEFITFLRILPDFFAACGGQFRIVKSDIEGNIKKLDTARAAYAVGTLPRLLTVEQTGNRDSDSSGSTGLLWLARTLEFLAGILDHLIASNQDDSMRHIVKQAYDKTLRRHHNKLMSHTFSLVLHVLPRRAHFLRKLALEKDTPDSVVLAEAARFLTVLKPVSKQLTDMLIDFGIETEAP